MNDADRLLLRLVAAQLDAIGRHLGAPMPRVPGGLAPSLSECRRLGEEFPQPGPSPGAETPRGSPLLGA